MGQIWDNTVALHRRPPGHHQTVRRGSSTVQQINQRAAWILPVAGMLIATVLAAAATGPVPLLLLGALAALVLLPLGLLETYWAVKKLARRVTA